MALYYVNYSGAGAKNGITLGNAWSYTGFNGSSNWSSPSIVAGKISPGDTVILDGIFTTGLNVQAGGTNSSPITILFNTGCILTNPAFDSNGAINIFQKSNLIIDGGTGGLIENTANGTNLIYQVDSYGVKAQSSSNLTVKNLTVSNLYVHVVSATGAQYAPTQLDSNAFGRGVSNTDGNGLGCINFIVDNCTFKDMFAGIDADYFASSGYVFSNNTAYNCNWGGRCGDRGVTSILTGLTVRDNYFHDWANWNATGSIDNGLHHNGFYAWAENGGLLINPVFYNNRFGTGWGGPFQTAGIFVSMSNGNISGGSYYNNVFAANSGEYAANGFITIGAKDQSTVRVYNNTMTGGGVGAGIRFAGASSGSATYDIKNNIAVGLTFISIITSGGITLSSNNNIGYNLIPGQEYSISPNGSSNFKTIAQWQALGYDLNSSSGNPLLTSTYRLSAGSPAIGSGVNESAYFNTDASNATRVVPWDIGAYAYYIYTIRRLGRRLKLKGLAPV